MELKDFERYLELVKINEEYINIWRETRSDENYENYDNVSKTREELSNFKNNLLKFVFGNQSSIETVIDKLKFRLNRFNEYAGSDENRAFNEIKMVKEILNLLEMYDWKLMHSEYYTGEVKQVAIWEQNGEGLIRRHKVWNVVDAINTTKDSGRIIGKAMGSISENINN